jgi:hypothetical protein
LYENINADPAQYAHIKESINNVMTGSRGGHPANGSSSNPSYGRQSAFTTNSTNGGDSLSSSQHLHTPPVFGQNSYPGYSGTQVRSGGGYGGSVSPAAVPQRPGTMPFRQTSHSNLHGLMNRPALQFKQSPFYRVEQMIGNVKMLESMLKFPSGAYLCFVPRAKSVVMRFQYSLPG